MANNHVGNKNITTTTPPPVILNKMVSSNSSNSLSSHSTTSPSNSPPLNGNVIKMNVPIPRTQSLSSLASSSSNNKLPIVSRKKAVSSSDIATLLSSARIDRINVETISKYIKHIPLFKILNPIELNVVAGNLTIVTFQAGTIVFEAMSSLSDLYIVYDGELFCEEESNKIKKNFKKGDSISPFCLIKSYQVPVNIIALNEVKCLLLRRPVFQSLFKRFDASLKLLGKENNDIIELKMKLNKSTTRREYIDILKSYANILHLLPILYPSNSIQRSDEIGSGGRDQTIKDYNREEVLMIGEEAQPMGTTSLFYSAFTMLSNVVVDKLLSIKSVITTDDDDDDDETSNNNSTTDDNTDNDGDDDESKYYKKYHSDGEEGRKLTSQAVAVAARRSLLYGTTSKRSLLKKSSSPSNDNNGMVSNINSSNSRRRRRSSTEMTFSDRIVWEILQASTRTSHGGDAYTMCNNLFAKEGNIVITPASQHVAPTEIHITNSKQIFIKAYNSFRACRFNTDNDEPRVWCHFHTTIMKELQFAFDDDNNNKNNNNNVHNGISNGLSSSKKRKKSLLNHTSSSISIILDLEAFDSAENARIALAFKRTLSYGLELNNASFETRSVVVKVPKDALNNNGSIWYSAGENSLQLWLDSADDVICVGWRNAHMQAAYPSYRIDIDLASLDGVRVLKTVSKDPKNPYYYYVSLIIRNNIDSDKDSDNINNNYNNNKNINNGRKNKNNNSKNNNNNAIGSNNIVALEIRVDSNHEKEWLLNGFNTLIRSAKFHAGKDLMDYSIEGNYVQYNGFNDESTVNARFRSQSSNIEHIIVPKKDKGGKTLSIGDDTNQWTNIELQRQLELANKMLDEEAEDQNYLESSKQLLNYIENVYEKDLLNSKDRKTIGGDDNLSSLADHHHSNADDLNNSMGGGNTEEI